MTLLFALLLAAAPASPLRDAGPLSSRRASYEMKVTLDATRKTIYVGTWIGVYESTDAGASWHPFGSGLPLAMDDERSWKRASAFCAGVSREDSVSIVVALIKASVLTIAEADAIKADWEKNHRFAKKHWFFGFGAYS